MAHPVLLDRFDSCPGKPYNGSRPAWLVGAGKSWSMASIRHLSNAPITEALIDFRARLSPGSRVEDLGTVSELTAAYPTREDAWLIEGSFAFSPTSAQAVASSAQRPNGYLFRSADGKQIAQFRLDGFTFNRLAPYTSWDEVEPEALRLWEIYRSVARPASLYRIAVRTINHIALPGTATELDDLLTCAPRIPPEVPQLMAGFLSRVVVPLPMANTHVGIVQAMQLPPAAPPNTILLDLDVFRTEELDPSAEALRPIFTEFRTFKNRAFFGSLTEEAVRLFE